MIGAIVIALVAILVFCSSVAFVWACIVIAKNID